MMRNARCNALLVVLFLAGSLQLVGCRTSQPQPQGRVLRGMVTDPQNQPVSGVEVWLGGRFIGRTNRSGAFAIHGVPADDRVAVSFRAPRYIDTTRIYERRPAPGNPIVIWPRAAAVRVDAAVGGTLTFPRGTITFAPDSFVTAGGGRAEGAVDVAMTVVDLADARQVASVPGDFSARMRDGSIQLLETFGLFELVARDARGGQLALAPERPARVAIALPRERRMPPTIGVYRFEESDGRWLEQTSLWTAGEAEAATQITATGWWNADVPLDTTCMQVHVASCHFCAAADDDLAGAWVKVTGEDYTGPTSQGWTGSDKKICLPVKKGAHVKIEVNHNGQNGNALHMVPTATQPLDAVSDCGTACPVTRTHVKAAGFTDSLQAKVAPPWCVSKGTNDDPFAVRWVDDDMDAHPHMKFSNSGMEIILDDRAEDGTPCGQSTGTEPGCDGRKWASAEYRTECFHGYGTYTATITPPAQTVTGENKGLVTAFFTFTGGDDETMENNAVKWDEIDFEIMGRAPKPYIDPSNTGNGIDDKLGATTTCKDLIAAGETNIMVVQTNYIVKGAGQGVNEIAYCLPFGTYTYRFDWTPTGITWWYDGGSGWKPLRNVTYPAGEGPTQPGRVFLSLWASESTLAWVDGPFVYDGTARTARFKDVTVP